MKFRLLLLSLLAAALLNDLLAVLPACITVPNGVVLFTDSPLKLNPQI